MLIQVEETPNPMTLKFLLGVLISPEGGVEFKAPQEAAQVPLARKLFDVDGVERIFFGDRFIAVTKRPEAEWGTLKTIVLSVLLDHSPGDLGFLKVQEELAARYPQNSLEAEIDELIRTRIKPVVQQDGGDIELLEFVDGIVYVTLKGACSGCPSAAMTLKGGIENMLKHYIPEIVEVRSMEGHLE